MRSKATGNRAFKHSSRVDGPLNRLDDSVLIRISKELSLWATQPQIGLNKLRGREFRVRDPRERERESERQRESERERESEKERVYWCVCERERNRERKRSACLDRPMSGTLHDPL